MALVWHDTESFQRHAQAMKVFRRAHGSYPGEKLPFGDIPAPLEIRPAGGQNMVTCFVDARGKAVLVPIWNMSMPPGSGN